MLGHLLHDDGVAQVRLVGAIFAHGLGIGNARPFFVTGLPSPNSSKMPVMTGSIAAKTSSWVTKLISTSSW